MIKVCVCVGASGGIIGYISQQNVQSLDGDHGLQNKDSKLIFATRINGQPHKTKVKRDPQGAFKFSP